MKPSEMIIKRKETIEELAVRNELPIMKVMEIYTKASCKIYFRESKKNKKVFLYNPALEEQIFKLVEKYFDINKWRELRISKN